MRWLDDGGDGAIRRALHELAPELADESIDHVDRVPDLDPDWFRGTARVGDDHFVKFAWSAVPAQRIGFEATVVAALSERGLPVPSPIHPPSDLACFVTDFVDGQPFDPGNVPDGERLRTWARSMAGFLVELHESTNLSSSASSPPEHWVQATTDQLRDDAFLAIVGGAQRNLIERWCAWCDDVLADEVSRVLVHGDLHGFNMQWDPATAELLLVADFEMAGMADPALDFRYQTTNAPTNDLVLAVIDAYRSLGGVVETERVAAWTILSVLGDARWRSLAGIGLPDDGTPEGWVDDLARRLPQLCPAVPTP